MGKDFVKQANKIIFDFIWKGEDKIKRSTLVSEIEYGVLKTPQLDWVYYWNAESNSFQEIDRRTAEQLENNSSALHKTCWREISYMSGNFELQKLPINLPKFSEECLKRFAKCSAANRGSVQDLNGNDLAKIILWNNKFICIGGKSVYFKTLADKGIIKNWGSNLR